ALGHLLDVHAAFGRHHEGDARGFAIDQGREVELAVDQRAVLDVEPVDLLAATGLAAPAGMDLRLYDPDRSAELARGLGGFIGREGRNAARHRHAVVAQYRLGLIFVDVHAATCPMSGFAKYRDAPARAGWAREFSPSGRRGSRGGGPTKSL